MLPNVGMGELAGLLLFALVIFGPKRLPEMARSLGKGIRDFKAAVNGLDEPPAPLPYVDTTADAHADADDSA